MKFIQFFITATFLLCGFLSRAQQVSSPSEINTANAQEVITSEAFTAPAEKMIAAVYPVASFPFNQTGFISYHAPANFTTASIVVMDSKAEMVKEYAIDEAGEGYITVFGGTFSPGTYFYGLSVNGIIMEKRKLVITH